jgi:hypothetical protein
MFRSGIVSETASQGIGPTLLGLTDHLLPAQLMRL